MEDKQQNKRNGPAETEEKLRQEETETQETEKGADSPEEYEEITAEVVEDEEKPEEKGTAEQAADYRDSLLRVQADFQNYKKRAEKERQRTVQYANEKLILQLLPVMDNFDRALATEKEKDAFYDGMSLIYDQLAKVLKDNGVEVEPSDGEKFDPQKHNCVLTEASDKVESGYIIETLQKGYLLNGKLIRPAMVKVAS